MRVRRTLALAGGLVLLSKAGDPVTLGLSFISLRATVIGCLEAWPNAVVARPVAGPVITASMRCPVECGAIVKEPAPSKGRR